MVFASNGPSRRYTTTRDSTDDPTGGDVDEAVGGSVGYALAIAISPIPIAALNPKDILLAAAGGAEIASTNLSDGSTVVALVALVVFTAIAASTATLPVGAYLVAGDRLDDRLHHVRDWLIRHNPVVIAVVLVAVGALFLGEGIQILRG
ncbi:MAG: GAP family protein [Acidimicrobiales bacterium]